MMADKTNPEKTPYSFPQGVPSMAVASGRIDSEDSTSAATGEDQEPGLSPHVSSTPQSLGTSPTLLWNDCQYVLRPRENLQSNVLGLEQPLLWIHPLFPTLPSHLNIGCDSKDLFQCCLPSSQVLDPRMRTLEIIDEVLAMLDDDDDDHSAAWPNRAEDENNI